MSLKKVVFGPGADGAKLEGSKNWMKNLVEKAGVPTAKFQSFNENQIMCYKHDERECIYDESIAVEKLRLDDSDRIKIQMEYVR